MILKVRLLVFLSFLSISVNAFQLPKSIKRKMDKEIKSTFQIEGFTIETVDVSKEMNVKLITKITSNNFYRIIQNDTIIGYAFTEKAASKTDQFDYLVLFDIDLIIKKTKVLVYREDYGGEISSKRWLRQFEGKTSSEQLKYEKDIVAISGATISAKSMTVAVNNLLKTMDILQENNFFE